MLLTGLIQLLSCGGASASRPPSVFISRSVSGGGAGPKAEDQSLLCICQGDRTLRRLPSGTMTPSLSHGLIEECGGVEIPRPFSLMQFVNTERGSVPDVCEVVDLIVP